MTNKEKRYVEVDVNWDDENKVWYEYDGDGSYNTYSTTATLPELIIKEHPGLREKMAKALHGVSLETATVSMFAMSWEESKQQTKDFYYAQADAILSILGIKKEG